MAQVALPPSDEPVDFRHQAGGYARYRRGYSPALYDAIDARTGPPAERAALDLGCGTGLVTVALAERGWRATGVDFSAPMLAQAVHTGTPRLRLVRGGAENLPIRSGTVSLVTCGTAFHWFSPAPALAEITRVLAPGGWAALFWRFARARQPHMVVVLDVLRGIGVDLPDDLDERNFLPTNPFESSPLHITPMQTLDTTLTFTAASFHGYIATVEWLRRLAGTNHEAFLLRLKEALQSRYPGDFTESSQEYLFLARKP